MTDWKALIRTNLDLSRLTPSQQTETITELADHLEDLYQHYRAQGLDDAKAAALAIDQMSAGWRIAKEIQKAKGEAGSMNIRTRQVWMPTLTTMSIAILAPPLLTMLFFALHLKPSLPALEFRCLGLLWTATAVLAGVVGASASRRAGGSRLLRMAPALAASLCYPAVVGCVLLAHSVAPHTFAGSDRLPALFLYFVLTQAVALSIGSLPFLVETNHRVDGRAIG
jgi:hypothetical protein